jgi:hypothetical protein
VLHRRITFMRLQLRGISFDAAPILPCNIQSQFFLKQTKSYIRVVAISSSIFK